MVRKRTDLAAIFARKAKGEKIPMLTAYDAPTAQALEEAGVDVLLVGDSAANVVLGYHDTLPVSMEEMLVLTAAVVRGAPTAFVIADMPFMSFNVSIEEAIRNGGRFIKQAGAQAVKIEGGGPVAETLQAMVQAGIPTVGHLGLTPQTANMLGGYRVQGKSADAAERILRDAELLEAAGACMLVLECVPDRLAELITRQLSIPTIGIGAGPHCDGQVLVVHDMLGIRSGFTPKFVKAYETLGERMKNAAQRFRAEVLEGSFPGPEHGFALEEREHKKLLARLDHDPEKGETS